MTTRSFPSKCPGTGLCLPVTYDHCRDGDTVVVRIPGSVFTWAIRLKDCWCPPLSTLEGYEATQLAEKLLVQADPTVLRLFIPAPTSSNVLKDLLSFDRIIGYIFISEHDNTEYPFVTLNEALVMAGKASSSKNGELGA